MWGCVHKEGASRDGTRWRHAADDHVESCGGIARSRPWVVLGLSLGCPWVVLGLSLESLRHQVSAIDIIQSFLRLSPQEQLAAGETIARCPSCSLTVRVCRVPWNSSNKNSSTRTEGADGAGLSSAGEGGAGGAAPKGAATPTIDGEQVHEASAVPPA